MTAIDQRIRPVLEELERRLDGLYRQRLVRMMLYGSQARGDAEPGSDIDVLVVLKGPVDANQEIERTGEIVSELSLAHSVVIACLFMDEEAYLHRQGPLLRNIRREGIPLYESGTA